MSESSVQSVSDLSVSSYKSNRKDKEIKSLKIIISNHKIAREVLLKRFESLEAENTKLEAENKKLKDENKRNSQHNKIQLYTYRINGGTIKSKRKNIRKSIKRK